jgi:hypothetical protein
VTSGFIFRASGAQQGLQRTNEFRPGVLQFLLMRACESTEYPLATGGQLDEHLAAVVVAARTREEAFIDEPANEFDRAVVREKQAVRDVTNGGPATLGQAFDGEKELVLLRFDSGGPCPFFTEVQETPDLITQLGKRAVVCLHTHLYIVLRYT